MFVSQGDASVLLRIGAVDSEKRHYTLRDNMFSRNKNTALVTGASSWMGKAGAFARPMMLMRKWMGDRVLDRVI